MIIVSCPYCYKAQYIVVSAKKRHEQQLECGACKRTYLIKVKPRRGSSGRVDAECARLEELGSPTPAS